VDRLAAMINVDSLYIPVSQRVSIDIEPAAMKIGAEVAEILRQYGWVVLFALPEQKAIDCGWEVQVKATEPQLCVLNRGSGEKSDCESPIEVLAIVGSS
jgi:hypothetical protein